MSTRHGGAPKKNKIVAEELLCAHKVQRPPVLLEGLVEALDVKGIDFDQNVEVFGVAGLREDADRYSSYH